MNSHSLTVTVPESNPGVETGQCTFYGIKSRFYYKYGSHFFRSSHFLAGQQKARDVEDRPETGGRGGTGEAGKWRPDDRQSPHLSTVCIIGQLNDGQPLISSSSRRCPLRQLTPLPFLPGRPASPPGARKKNNIIS